MHQAKFHRIMQCCTVHHAHQGRQCRDKRGDCGPCILLQFPYAAMYECHRAERGSLDTFPSHLYHLDEDDCRATTGRESLETATLTSASRCCAHSLDQCHERHMDAPLLPCLLYLSRRARLHVYPSCAPPTLMWSSHDCSDTPAHYPVALGHCYTRLAIRPTRAGQATLSPRSHLL